MEGLLERHGGARDLETRGLQRHRHTERRRQTDTGVIIHKPKTYRETYNKSWTANRLQRVKLALSYVQHRTYHFRVIYTGPASYILIR